VTTAVADEGGVVVVVSVGVGDEGKYPAATRQGCGVLMPSTDAYVKSNDTVAANSPFFNAANDNGRRQRRTQLCSATLQIDREIIIIIINIINVVL
jgi:hypothetical protein